MASQTFNPAVPMKREWGTAFRALRRLLANGDDTVQVFRIRRPPTAHTPPRNSRRLIASAEGGRLAYQRIELAQRLCDRNWIDSFPEATVGAAYRAFLDRTGYSADGLAAVSVEDAPYPPDLEHPYAWFGRRERDVHDIWHVLTGYEADEPLGEACLVAFSFAQTGGLGWAFIGAGAAVKSVRVTGDPAFAKAVWEGWRHGKRAAWLHAEDYQKLMAEPLASARRRLRIAEPVRYREAQARLAEAGLKGI